MWSPAAAVAPTAVLPVQGVGYACSLETNCGQLHSCVPVCLVVKDMTACLRNKVVTPVAVFNLWG